MNEEGYIHFTCDEEIGIITINNPPENFLLEPDFIQIEDLRSFIASENIKGLIFTGAGRHFSAGADLDKLFAIAKDDKILQKKMEKGNLLLAAIEELEIPVISSIEGVCFGGGLEIALACHMRICSEKALFAFPEVNHNLMPGLGGIQRITGLLTGGLSYEMILGGDMLNAEKAHELNIVDHIVRKGSVLEYSTQFLKSLVRGKSENIIHAITRTINYCRKRGIDDTLNEVTKVFCKLAVTEAERRNKSNSEKI
jgi:enoyl-CoA hydratase